MILIIIFAVSYLQNDQMLSDELWMSLCICFWLFQFFKFDRFLKFDGKEKTFFKDGLQMNYGSMPWGAGSSLCPGREFAVCAVKRWVLTRHTLHQTMVSVIKIMNNKGIYIISIHLSQKFIYMDMNVIMDPNVMATLAFQWLLWKVLFLMQNYCTTYKG